MAPNTPYSERLFSQVERLKQAGFSPMPCRTLGKTPDCGKNETWEIAQAKDWRPNHNIGLWCKLNKIVVLDIDTIENTIQGSETDPIRIEQALINTFPELKTIPQESTPSGGKHYFFKENEKSIKTCMTGALTVNVNGKDVKLSVDIKAPGVGNGNGGFIVIAPSQYPLENEKQWKNKFGGKEYEEIIPIQSDNLIPMSEMMVAMFENHNIEYYKDSENIEKLRTVSENVEYQVHETTESVTGNTLRNRECCELILSKLPKYITDGGYDNWLRDAVIPVINAFCIGKQGTIPHEELFELMEKYFNPEKKYDRGQNMLKYMQILLENKSTKSIGSLMFLIKQNDPAGFIKLISTMREKNYMVISQSKMEFTHIDQINDILDDASIDTVKEFMSKTIKYVSGGGSPYYLVRRKSEKNIKEKERKMKNNLPMNEDDFMFIWEAKAVEKFEKLVLMCRYAKFINGDSVSKKSYLEIFKTIQKQLSVSTHVNMPYTPFENKDYFENKDMFNIFPGYTAKLVNVDQAHKNPNVDLILNHIKIVWCKRNEIKYDYVINWLAYNLQNPREKPDYGIVLKDIYKGSGKSRIIELMIKYVYGTCGLIYNGLDEYLSPRNNRRERGLLVFIDEVETVHPNVGKMKRYHTNLDDNVTLLYQETREIRNYNVFIYCTNNDYVLKAESGDRRYYYLDVSNEMKGNMDYFMKFEELSQYDWDCYYTVMMHRDLSQFDPRNPEMTEEKADNILSNIDMATKYLVESIVANDKPAWLITDGVKFKFHTQTMYNTVEGGSNFCRFCEGNGIKSVPTKTGMEATIIRSLGKMDRISIAGKRLMGYNLSMEEIKTRMANYHSKQIVNMLFNNANHEGD
jgi:hypothetical protein